MFSAEGKCSVPFERPSFEKELVALRFSLLAYAKGLTRSPDAAEELVQETVYKALKNKDKFIEGTSLRAWVFTIAKNQFLTECRRDRFRGEWDEELFDRTFTTDGEASVAEATIDFKRLLHCLAIVGQDRRDAIVAVGYLGLSYQDAASRLETEVGTIKSRVGRGRDELEALFNGGCELPTVDVRVLKTVAQFTPATHPYYPIAKAYEDLYTAFESSEVKLSEGEKAWSDLIASGALEMEDMSWDELARRSL
jgi:RNA polymerase sigma-70 factor (ECF subfamily)